MGEYSLSGGCFPSNDVPHLPPEALTPPTLPHCDVCDINTRGPGGLTPLMVLAMSRNQREVQAGSGKPGRCPTDHTGNIIFDLCTEGASLNVRSDCHGKTDSSNT